MREQQHHVLTMCRHRVSGLGILSRLADVIQPYAASWVSLPSSLHTKRITGSNPCNHKPRGMQMTPLGCISWSFHLMMKWSSRS
jgi:hypothetical protein